MSTKAIKWSSVLLIIGGALLAVPMLFHPDMGRPGYALLGAWVPVHVLLGIATLAVLSGLIVFYGAVTPKTTLIGMTGPLMAGAFGAVITVSMVIVAMGFILIGGYLISAKIISPANGVLFIIGAPLAAFSPPLPYAIGIIGAVLLGSALVWLGVSLRKGRAHDTLETTLRIHDQCLAQAGGRA